MGSCLSKQEGSRPRQPMEVAISAQAQAKALLLLQKFKVCSYLSQMLDGSPHGLDGVAYTQNQAIDLSKSLLQGVYQLQRQQNKEQRLTVQNIFSSGNIELIRKQQLHYYGMLEKLNKQDQSISQNIKSRVYHKIANLKKQKEIKKQWKNEYEISCITNNDYKVLSEEELEQVVKYEAISHNTQRMGEKIGFKFESIKRQSQTVIKVLSKVMVDHHQQINKLQYSLQTEEVMKMASISRDACNYYDNGVFLLLTYFVQSCKRVQDAGKSSQEIEKLLYNAIESISRKYPPGEGLSKENQSLTNNLKQLQIKKKGAFSHPQIPLKPTDKQFQVQQIIVNYAKTAEQCKDLFEELVKSTCIEKAVLFKIGLKLYPNNPNKKAMTRIKEKMLIAKNQKGEKNMSGTIKQILLRQDTNYIKQVDMILENSTAVPFKMSDMVRGKCVFLEISDILETVKAIKNFVSKDSRFTIQEIESRFTNATPISDVTLKIVINNKIVAELQLTIQTNAAAYNFAHKIYQLQRTKVFSKLKIIHNYFQESNEDFSQLASKALKLLNSKSIIPKDMAINIQKYFKLDSINDKVFAQILTKELQQKKALFPRFTNVVDPLLQDLMHGLFCMMTGLWFKPLGKIIDNALINEKLSPKLKSVLISGFLDKLQLPKESEYMQQLGFTQQQLLQKFFMEEYISEYYSIKKCFNYTCQNQRVFHRSQQLKQIHLSKYRLSAPIQLKQSKFVVNLIIEQHCLQNITRLRQLFDFYFVTRKDGRDKEDRIYDQFSYYYNWIDTQLKNNQKIDKVGLLRSQIAIIKAQQLLENNEPKLASEILLKAKKVFQSKEKQEKVIYCDVLLTECFIKQNKQTLKKSIDKHNTEVVKKAETLGLQLKGALYADALWRISEYFWALVKDGNTDEKKTLLTSFTKHLSSAKWDNLTQLNLFGNRIGDDGCKYLSGAKWDRLTQLDLTNNEIGTEGCKWLSSAKWKNLTHLNLNGNKTGDAGCKHLSSARWDNLTQLELMSNSISAEGCKNLSIAKWANLTKLNLWYNQIGDQGCKNLSIAKWANLTNLNLEFNQIGADGCKYLSSAKWDHMSQLNISANSIGANGCKQLSNAKWNNLTIFKLQQNNIGDDGCKYLSSAKWDNLTFIHLRGNSITPQGCKNIISAKWNNLTQLIIDQNHIDTFQKEQLKTLIKKSFPKIPQWWTYI